MLSVVQPYADRYVLSSRRIPAVLNLFDAKYLNVSYPELFDVCMAVKLDITKEQIDQIERHSGTSEGYQFRFATYISHTLFTLKVHKYGDC